MKVQLKLEILTCWVYSRTQLLRRQQNCVRFVYRPFDQPRRSAQFRTTVPQTAAGNRPLNLPWLYYIPTFFKHLNMQIIILFLRVVVKNVEHFSALCQNYNEKCS